MPPVPFKKHENPEEGSGKQDREQSRIQTFENEDKEQPENNPDSVDFERKMQNEQDGDTERDPKKRKAPGEDPDQVAKQGKDFEPGIDDNTKSI